MELNTLLIGIILTIEIFALKGGVGIHYFLLGKRDMKTRLFFLSLYGLVYLFLFLLCSHTVQGARTILYFDAVQGLLKSGMSIHALMAGGLTVWGVVLLKRGDRFNRGTYGWLVMMAPCPVSIAAIFLGTALVLSYFPDSGHVPVVLTYLVFMGIVLITVISMRLWGYRSASTAASTMGGAMLIMAVYFFLCVIMMPQFRDIDKIYRVAAYKGEKRTINPGHSLLLCSIMAVSFTGGFIYMLRKLKRKKRWM